MASETTFDLWKVFFFHEEKWEKLDFLKTRLTSRFDILESNSIYIFVHENKKMMIVNIFSLDACSGSMCLLTKLTITNKLRNLNHGIEE